jgi:hypothetical protein
MLLVVKSANAGRPPIGFCIDWLLGFKYVGSLVIVGDFDEFRKAVKK